MSELATQPNLADNVARAKMLADASLLPDAYRKQPANILLAIEMAEALRISLTQAINGVTVIKGKPTISPELMRALVIREGHRLKVDTLTAEGCRLLVARREFPNDVQEFTFTAADAQRAGLAGENWKRFPQAMLLARATALACRAVFPDVIAGVSYVPEELDTTPAYGLPAVPPLPLDLETGELLPPAIEAVDE